MSFNLDQTVQGIAGLYGAAGLVSGVLVTAVEEIAISGGLSKGKEGRAQIANLALGQLLINTAACVANFASSSTTPDAGMGMTSIVSTTGTIIANSLQTGSALTDTGLTDEKATTLIPRIRNHALGFGITRLASGVFAGFNLASHIAAGNIPGAASAGYLIGTNFVTGIANLGRQA